MFLGLRSLIYSTGDLGSAKAWYAKVLGIEPFYDEALYAGYDVGGFELGLFAGGDPAGCPATCWGVADVDDAASTFQKIVRLATADDITAVWIDG